MYEPESDCGFLEGVNLELKQARSENLRVKVLEMHINDMVFAEAVRAGRRALLRVRQDVNISDLSGENAYLLCDTGAGMEDLPKTTMVVDHHLPLFEGEFHVNPRLAGIDGDRQFSAAGTAYFVARKLGDNRDLAGLLGKKEMNHAEIPVSLHRICFADAQRCRAHGPCGPIYQRRP